MNRQYTILALGFFSLLFSFQVKSECVKTMAWNDDFPYAFKLQPEDNQPTGINIELVLAVFAESKCQLRFLSMPWARALVELEEGRIDIIGGAHFNQERQEFARYSTIDFHFPNVLFIRKDISKNIELNTLNDIKKHQLKIGVQIDVYYGTDFEKMRLAPEFSRLIYPNTSRKALWGMLSLGRIDGVIADIHSGQGEIKQLGLSQVIMASDLIISDQGSYYIFSKKSVEQSFVDDFDDALKRLKTSGKINDILKKYSP